MPVMASNKSILSTVIDASPYWVLEFDVQVAQIKELCPNSILLIDIAGTPCAIVCRDCAVTMLGFPITCGTIAFITKVTFCHVSTS